MSTLPSRPIGPHRRAAMLNAIVGILVDVEILEGQWKLGQHRAGPIMTERWWGCGPSGMREPRLWRNSWTPLAGPDALPAGRVPGRLRAGPP